MSLDLKAVFKRLNKKAKGALALDEATRVGVEKLKVAMFRDLMAEKFG